MAHLGYGRGELAEGYKAEDRLKTVAAKPKPKPAPRKKPPKKTKRKPSRAEPTAAELGIPSSPATASRLVGGKSPRPTTQPAIRGMPVPQIESQVIETTVSVPDGGTLLLGGQKGGVEREMGVPILSKIPILNRSFTNRASVRSGNVAGILARNYYRSGQEFYAGNNYRDAATALKKVVEMAPQSTEATNALRLLGNIDLAQGKLKAQTRGEKVAAAKVRREQQASQQDVQQKFTAGVRAAEKALAEGKVEQARAQLQVAQSYQRGFRYARPAQPDMSNVGIAADALEAQVEQAEQAKAAGLRKQYSQLKSAGRYGDAVRVNRKLQETTARWKSDEGRKETAALRKEMEGLTLQAVKQNIRGSIAPQTWTAGRDAPAGAKRPEPGKNTGWAEWRPRLPAPKVGEGKRWTDPTTGVVSTGDALDVTGTVSADRRYVTLGLRPQVTKNVEFFEYAMEQAKRKAPPRPGEAITLLTDGAVDAEVSKLNELLNRPRELKEVEELAQMQKAVAEDVEELAQKQEGLARRRRSGGTAVKVLLPAGADPDALADAVNDLYGRRRTGDVLEARQAGEFRAETTGDDALILTGPKNKVDRAMVVLSRADTLPRVRRMAKSLNKLARAERSVDKIVDLRRGAKPGGGRGGRKLSKEIEELAKPIDAADIPDTYVFPLKNADAAGIAKTLKLLFAKASAGRRARSGGAPAPSIRADGATNSLVVAADPEQRKQIARLVQQLDGAVLSAPVQVHIYALKHADAAGVAETLKRLFASTSAGRGGRAQAPSIQADGATNSLVVAADPEQWKQIARLVQELDAASSGPALKARLDRDLRRSVDRDPTSGQMVLQLRDLKRRHAESARSLGPVHRTTKQLRSMIESLEKQAHARNKELAREAGAIERLEATRAVSKQRVLVQYQQATQRAREAMQTLGGADDFNRATQEVRYARTLVDARKSFLTDNEYREKKAETDLLLDWIALEKDKWEKLRVSQQRREIEGRQVQRVLPMRRQKAEKSAALKRRVRKLRDAGKYAEAVEVLDSLRRLDPSDKWAAEWYEQLSRFVLLMDEKNARRLGLLPDEQKQMVDIRWSQVPWQTLARYPRDRDETTLGRRPFGSGEVSEGDADRAVRRELTKVLPRLQFPGIGFGDVIQFFRDVSNLNIHVNWEAVRVGGRDERMMVNVMLTNISLKRALRAVLDDVGGAEPLDYVVEDGVISISTRSDLARRRQAARQSGTVGRDRPRQAAPTPAPAPRNFFNETASLGPARQARPETPADAAVKRQLQKVLPKLHFPGLGFGDVVQFFRDVSSLSVHPNWPALRAANIDERSPVNVMLTDVTLDKALRVVLEDVGGATPLDYAVIDGRIVVSTRDDLAAGHTTRVYDVRDLVLTAGNAGKDGRRQEKEIVKSLGEVAGGVSVSMLNGQKLFVTGGAEQQRLVQEFFTQLRDVRGPQVNVSGRRIAGQRSQGLSMSGTFLDDIQADFLISGDQVHVSELEPVVTKRATTFDPTIDVTGDARGLSLNNPRLQEFLDSNYDWAARRAPAKLDGGWGYVGATVPDGGTLLAGGQGLDQRQFLTTWNASRLLPLSETDLVKALGRNIGQKVMVNSTNINVGNPTAVGMGMRFVTGANGVSYTVIDEAQMRTLLELDARNASRAGAVAANGRLQETIVGTDALLANTMIANPRFADDRSNQLDIKGNTINLVHEKYVLIDNGSFLTAVRAGPMQHWTETPADVRFADVPADIDVPHVGRLVKFEKTLVEPTDRLVLRAAYEWKGE